ncbi:hypothetical protein M8R20_07900 [Pseudomonas sp. R2.Fl]|nr:hypothetical protein [Pseudomonas sp. R2.Fl]
MQKILTAAALLAITTAFTVSPQLTGFESAAYAKDGNGGGGKGGGNGGGKGNGGGNGNGHSGKSANAGGHSKSGTNKSLGKTLQSLFAGTAPETAKTNKGLRTQTQQASLKTRKTEKNALAGLNSLNRNYHAYLNSNDPRMTAVSAYAVAYAEYELANGVGTLPTDPALDDEALRAALASFSKDPTVSVDDATLSWAKDVLGVGEPVGKIDEIRDSLAASQVGPEPVEDVEVATEEVSETTTTVTTVTVSSN